MLKLSKNDGTPIGSFDSYRDLYLHINHVENMKLMNCKNPEFYQLIWTFQILSPIRVKELINNLKKEYDPEILTRAVREQSGIIEICEGDVKKLRVILASPEVDVDDHRKDFQG